MQKMFLRLSNSLNIIMLVIALICFYAILQIRLNYFWPIWYLKNADAVNSIIESFSFSYVAAYFFYLMTIGIPNALRKAKLKPIIRSNVRRIGFNDFRSVVLEFSRETDKKADYHDVEQTKIILSSKNWDDIVPMIYKWEGVKITYFRYLSVVLDHIKDEVLSIIDRYKNELRLDQLVSLEELYELVANSIITSLSKHSDTRVNDGRMSLIEDFIKIQNKYLYVEKSFGLEPEKIHKKSGTP